jgi:hypothetical protein
MDVSSGDFAFFVGRIGSGGGALLPLCSLIRVNWVNDEARGAGRGVLGHDCGAWD